MNELKQINLTDVSSMYSGKRRACCCGCSGKYTYSSQHREWASKNRGYTVDDDDINDRAVKMAVTRMNKRLASGDYENLDIASNGQYVVIEAGERIWIAYLKYDNGRD